MWKAWKLVNQKKTHVVKQVKSNGLAIITTPGFEPGSHRYEASAQSISYTTTLTDSITQLRKILKSDLYFIHVGE